jgi:serine protease Do
VGQSPYQQPRPAQSYQWNFNDYNQSDGLKSGKARKKRAPLGFVVLIAAVIIATAAYALTRGRNWISPEITESNGTQSYDSSAVEEYHTVESVPSALATSSEAVLHITDTSSAASSTESVSGGVLSVKQINKKLVPSVVGIQTYSPSDMDTEPIAEGSGVIMDTNGYIITNAHVLELSSNVLPKVKVVLHDERSFEGTIVGKDRNTDIAVIKINAPNLVAAEFGDSKILEVGDLVVAIGNPGGLAFAGSTTNGIVSGVDRKLTDQNGYTMSCIQTNAAINPGNSGGALANAYGQVVGITSSKISDVDYEGMGFAIPIHEAMPIINELIANGRVTGRPMIGITYKSDQIIDEMLSSFYGVPTGIVVDSVNPESDAYKKDLRPGDIIHKIDNTVITGISDVQLALSGKKSSDTVALTIFRRTDIANDQAQGDEFTIRIILMENTGS